MITMSDAQATETRSGLSDVPLSFTQEFLTMFSSGGDTGSFGPRYHVVRGLRLHGELDLGLLRGALDDVVARHESLRTLMYQDGDSWRQEIQPPSSPALLVRDLPETAPRPASGRRRSSSTGWRTPSSAHGRSPT
ncbi:hypothetical protein [Actinomadura sp. CNU-125]|uniref:hypothetical protein n=1 Tax=Actinomadura sp. CNU-125 TaxID=1904961 RepID=UPI0021CD006F|nr:hypothetical protein [Actinomadura sp. CNU-125]